MDDDGPGELVLVQSTEVAPLQRVWYKGIGGTPMSIEKKESGMPWHKVVIINNERSRWSAAELMRPFIMGYNETGSTPPKNAVVYHGLNDTGDHVYYFSPEASEIALSAKAFHGFDVIQCAENPHLDGCEKVTIS